MPYFIECFDGRLSPDRAAKIKKGFAWTALSLGIYADRGFPTDDDPQLLDVLDKMRTHPLMTGLRIRFKNPKVKPVKVKPADDTVTDTFLEGTGDLDAFVSEAVLPA